MKDRLTKLIAELGLSPAKFAEKIGIQRSSISHIISGRNKPSFDFIEKLLISYPNVNIEWLILGKGDIFKGEAINVSKTLFTEQDTYKDNSVKVDSENKVNSDKTENPEKNTLITSVNKVLLIYSDNTFTELKLRN